MVARRLTSQHTFTTALLSAETPPPLLAGLPFARSLETGNYEVEQLDLLDRRLEVLTRKSLLPRVRTVGADQFYVSYM